MGKDLDRISSLFFSVDNPLRLITPIFIHFGFQHIVFNSIGIWELGKIYEAQKGIISFIIFVLIVSVISNTTQYLIFGLANFGGLSGLFYGIFGYLWIRGFKDDECKLSNEYISISILWFALCWTGLLGPIANWAHAGGLIVGCIWAYIESNLFTKKISSSLAKLPAKKQNIRNDIKSNNVGIIAISCIIFFVITVLVIFKNHLNIPLNFNYTSNVTPDDVIVDISGEWKADTDKSIWQIDLNKKNITIKSEDGAFETQIPILIKNVDTLNEKVAIEWDDIATNKKIIGTFSKIMSDDQNKFTIKLTLDNGDVEIFSEFIRQLGNNNLEEANSHSNEINVNEENLLSHFANNIKNQFKKNKHQEVEYIDDKIYSMSNLTLEDKLIIEEILGEKFQNGGLDKYISKADFNDDGIDDFLIVENNSEFCGSGGCSTYLISLGPQPKLYYTNYTNLGGLIKFKLGKKSSAGIKNLIIVKDGQIIYGDKKDKPLYKKPLEYEFYLGKGKLLN
jgi:membrane associated rhomboid family serine protease